MKKGVPAPELGMFGWLTFDPQAGHEPAGRRPALVLSHTRYNEKTGLAIFCPVTNKAKGYPFELAVPEGLKVSGVVVCDHLRSQDWRERQWTPICKAPAGFVGEVMKLALTLLDVSE